VVFAAPPDACHAGTSYLIRNADGIFEEVDGFFKTYRADLPKEVNEAFDRFVAAYGGLNRQEKPRGIGASSAATTLALLGTFRAEFEFLISDTEMRSRSLVDRAITHLQRTIMADEVVRQRWIDAYRNGEPACEKLGACHFLSHGIWAFKANSEGGRTDLVLNTDLEITDNLRSSAEALVLTEWKLVRDGHRLEAVAKEAYDQACRYTKGVLAGFELASRRYLVLVSDREVRMPAPKKVGRVTYEYRNIAVNPDVPSRAAKRTKQ